MESGIARVAETQRAKRSYLFEIDFMRACIMFGVVSVHVSAFVNGMTFQFTPQNISLEALISSLHFTREAFMFITGIVLFTTYYHSRDSVLSFWKKRFQLIVIPYIVWTIVYILFEGTYVQGFQWNLVWLLRVIGQSLLSGDQFFLYYILVTMQFYLIFPLVVMFLRRFSHVHWWILGGSFVLQICMMWFDKTILETLNPSTLPGWLSILDQYRDRLVITYQFWFIAGAIFAIHYKDVAAWIDARRKAVYICFGLMTLILWGHALIDRMVLRQSDGLTVLVLQPIMIPYAFLTALLMWQLGRAWLTNKANLPIFVNQLIQFFSRHSFGIFLLHPFALTLAEIALYRAQLPINVDIALILPTVVAIYSCAGLLASGFSKVPYLSYLVGRRAKAYK